MSSALLSCDQAIFTSIRTPMGEGYRIIAATPTLRADEKQVITRFSPSHEGLCSLDNASHATDSAPPAVAFYPLTTGRLCAAISFAAGAEHTGRGGQRIYTHNVIIDEGQFAQAAFNPFNILRAMVAAGLNNPQLKPPAALPTIDLTVESPPTDGFRKFPPAMNTAVRCCVLQGLLADTNQVIDIEGGFSAVAEALLLGLPGPRRTWVSFGAGLRFSAARCHRLNLVHDPNNNLKARLAGHPVELIKPGGDRPPTAEPSAWIAFVERHWNAGSLEQLASRTARPYGDNSPEGRRRVAELFNLIDGMADESTDRLLDAARQFAPPALDEAEQSVRVEFLTKAGGAVEKRITTSPWKDTRHHWSVLLNIWRGPATGRAFAQPILWAALNRATTEDPIEAVHLALQIAREFPPSADEADIDKTLVSTINAAGKRLRQATNPDLARLAALIEQWHQVRPSCEAIAELERLCNDLSTPSIG